MTFREYISAENEQILILPLSFHLYFFIYLQLLDLGLWNLKNHFSNQQNCGNEILV